MLLFSRITKKGVKHWKIKYKKKKKGESAPALHMEVLKKKNSERRGEIVYSSFNRIEAIAIIT